MSKIIRFFVGILFALTLFTFVSPAFAQTPAPQTLYMKAAIVKYTDTTAKQSGDQQTALQPMEVKILDGAEKGKIVSLMYDPTVIPEVALHPGNTIIIGEVTKITGATEYYFVDQARFSPIILVLLGFMVLILLVAGRKGIGSILGCATSLGVIFFFIVPQIIKGADPLTICTIGAVGILFVTTYVAHGISKRTTIALVSTLLALGITYFLAQFVAHITLLNGYGDQEAAELHFGLLHGGNILHLLLGGIIITTLGALNDITITQAAAIFILHKENPNTGFKKLASQGFAIGREHAISLVNTLVLAYAGASLSLFIFFFYNPNQLPLWVVLNSEFLTEEIMKIIVGTSGLLLSVPIATLLASAICQKKVTGFVGDFIYSYFH